MSAQSFTPSSERVNAAIDPHGAATKYHVQYGTVSCAQVEVSCIDTPEREVGEGQVAAEGFDDVTVHQVLERLDADTTYYYRVIATNEHGSTVSPKARERSSRRCQAPKPCWPITASGSWFLRLICMARRRSRSILPFLVR